MVSRAEVPPRRHAANAHPRRGQARASRARRRRSRPLGWRCRVPVDDAAARDHGRAARGHLARRRDRADRGRHRRRRSPSNGAAPRAASSRSSTFVDRRTRDRRRRCSTASPGSARTGCASSVGWLAMNPVEREDYRRFGGLEAEIASAGIVRRFVWRIKSGDESVVADRRQRRLLENHRRRHPPGQPRRRRRVDLGGARHREVHRHGGRPTWRRCSIRR